MLTAPHQSIRWSRRWCSSRSPLVARPFPGRHEVAHDGERQREEPARAEPLQRPEARQGIHRMSERTGCRPGDEDGDRREEETLAAVDVRQLPVQRRRNGRRDQIGGRDPGLHAQPVQVIPDGPDGRRDDGLIERRQEHAEHQPGEHLHDLPMPETRRLPSVPHAQGQRDTAAEVASSAKLRHPAGPLCSSALGGRNRNACPEAADGPGAHSECARPPGRRCVLLRGSPWRTEREGVTPGPGGRRRRWRWWPSRRRRARPPTPGGCGRPACTAWDGAPAHDGAGPAPRPSR